MVEKITKGAIKEFLASNIAFAVVIAYTVLLLCSIMDSVEVGGSLLGAVSTEIFSIIMCVGLWILCYSARNSDKINTTGFTLVKINVIFKFVAKIIISAILLICGIVLTFVGFTYKGADIDWSWIMETVDETLSAYGITNTTNLFNHGILDLQSDVFIDLIGVAGIILLFFSIIYLVILIIYNIFIIKTINSVSNGAETGIVDSKFPTFIVVMLYISAVLNGFSLLSAVVYLVYGRIWIFLGVIAQFVFYILVIVCVNKYKEAMKNAEERAASFAREDIAVEGNDAL